MQTVLILGGTNFIGRCLVEQMISEGEYEITLFNRGKTNNNLFQNVKQIRGDRRTNDIEQIANQAWDYVIDLSCYFPGDIKMTLENIQLDVKKYVFISTCSVYDMQKDRHPMRTENSVIHPCHADQWRSDDVSTYGNREAESERILSATQLPHVIFRPALVYGEYDTSDRLYYWLYQLQTHQDLLLPNAGKSRFSVTYVKDLVTCIIDSLKSSTTVTFNVTSLPQCSIRKIIDEAFKLLDSKSNIVNVDASFLHNHNVKEWMEMPLWLDNDLYTYDNAKLVHETGFAPINFETSIKETVQYFKSINWPKPTYGLPDIEKQRLIELTKSTQPTP